MNIKDSTATLLEPTLERTEYSMEVDKSIGSSKIRTAAIESEVKKAVDELTQDSDNHENSHSSLSKSIIENFGLDKVDKLNYGFKDSKNYSRKTQTWLGYVIDIDEEKFIAKLEDLNNPGGTHEIIEFSLDEVSPGDKDLLNRGSIFYWSVGSLMNNGQFKKESILRFKRVAQWSEEEYDKATDLADMLYKSFTWE